MGEQGPPSAGAERQHRDCLGRVSGGTEKDGVHGGSLSQPRSPLPSHTLGSTTAFRLPKCWGCSRGPSTAQPSAVLDPAPGGHTHQALPKYCWLPGLIWHAGDAAPSPKQAEGATFATAAFPSSHRFHGSKNRAAAFRRVLKLRRRENTN